MIADAMIGAGARSIASLAPAVSGLDRLSRELADIDRAAERGYFTPDEDERIRGRFAQYLTARAGLLQTINDLKPLALSRDGEIDDSVRLRAFVIAFTAAALLVRAGRFIIERYGVNSVVQRKLNEPEPRFGVPRKQFTGVYKSLTDPRHAWRLHEAMKFAHAHRDDIERLASDPDMSIVIDQLRQAESALHVSGSRYAEARLRYRLHSWRRRNASAIGQTMFGLFESAGRIIAEIHNPFHAKRLTPAIRDELANLLRPGDVMVSRHDDAMSNLFLPGYWVHASLHIGPEAARREPGIVIDAQRAARWVDPIRVLEAKKDGARFRALAETLAVDSVAVLRPTLSEAHIARGISQALTHEGKLYDFEFDFFRSDRVVCTEVVYRAYHGIGGMAFQLSRRAGRPTLAAEDLVDMALDGNGFKPVAVFGAPACNGCVISGPEAGSVLQAARDQRR